MHSTGVITNISVEVDGQRLIYSTCRIDKCGIGGPLIDFNGNFVGINMSSDNAGTLFMPEETFRHMFVASCMPRIIIIYGSDNTIEGYTSEIQRSSTPPVLNLEDEDDVQQQQQQQQQSLLSQASWGSSNYWNRNAIKQRSLSSTSDSESESPQVIDLESGDFHPLPRNEFTDALICDLNSRGYPLPKILDAGMHLRNNFEEVFSGDMWDKLPEEVTADTSRSVVSLASFKKSVTDVKSSEMRLFACTGVIIGSRKGTTRILTSSSLVRSGNIIGRNLKIEVRLPNNQQVQGKLQHYSLQYNIAVVSISNRVFDFRQTTKLHIEGTAETRNMVVAVGRTFETGKLMASSGMLTDKTKEFDCKELEFSTCKITKAGIGGPLIDFNGNFIGMNFYGVKKTPYIPRNIILEQLRHFDSKGSAAAEVTGKPKRKRSNRWPVPEPYWYYPSAAPRICRPGRVLF